MASLHFDPFDPGILDEPFAIHRRLRDETPAYYSEEFDCWFISRFQDIWDLESDQRNLSSTHGTTTTHLLTHQTPVAPNLTSYDGDEHKRIRKYFNPHFLPGAARRLEPLARELAAQAVDRALERGGGDAVSELGGWLSVRMACTILGIPLRDADQILEWVNGYFDREPGHRGTTARGLRAAKELGLHLFGLSRHARQHGAPEGSVLEQLLNVELEGERADDRAIAIHLNMMVIGGTETFPKIFSAALYRLAQHPEQRARCIADPALIPWAFHETLRFDMPTHMLGRSVANEFELHGQTLRPGSGIMFLWGSANRDEREFEQPGRFDVDRRAPRILSFGAGQHQCLGAHVARMEGRVLLEELLRRAPEYRIDEAGVVRLQSEFFRGFQRMPLLLRGGDVG